MASIRKAPLLAALILVLALLPATGAAAETSDQDRAERAAKQRAAKRCAKAKRRTARLRCQRRTMRRLTRRANRRVGVAGNAAVGTAAPSTGEDVLDAGFEQGLVNWNTAGVGEAVPSVVSDVTRSGARSSYVALSGSQGRSELILGGNGGGSTAGMVEFREGDEYYYAFSFYIESMVYGGPGAHNLIMQFKSDGEGSPNFGLQLWDYEGDNGDDGGRGLWSHGDAMGGDRFLAPVSEGAWHDVGIHFKASSGSAGFYEVYLDGQLLDARSGVGMIVPGHAYAYIKNGLYRDGSDLSGTSAIRLDAARLGRSWGAVAPS